MTRRDIQRADENRREGGRNHEGHEDHERDDTPEADIGHEERERRRAEDRPENHLPASEAVSNRTAKQRSRGSRAKEREERVLSGHRIHMEFLHHVERKEVCEGRNVDLLREHQYEENREDELHVPGGS